MGKILFLLYLADMHVAFRLLGAVMLIAIVVCIVIANTKQVIITKFKKWLMTLFVCVSLAFIFLPSPKTIYLWAALSVSPDIQELGNTDIAKKAVQMLNERIEKGVK